MAKFEGLIVGGINEVDVYISKDDGSKIHLPFKKEEFGLPADIKSGDRFLVEINFTRDETRRDPNDEAAIKLFDLVHEYMSMHNWDRMPEPDDFRTYMRELGLEVKGKPNE